ncbi:MAG: hypothetical protein HQL37_05915 [Alphaproteobacteria bacterium]|nr:hypothetical protein [Alphaproteobacteria bacterium]
MRVKCVSVLLALRLKRRLHNIRRQRGFALAPILYMLGLIGVGAGALFSGYSQILQSNIKMTNGLTIRNDLQASNRTVAGTSVLGASDATVFCPPQGGNASANCAAAPTIMTAIAGQSTLPSGTAGVGTGSPTEYGVFLPGAGVKVLDAYGHNYIYCRWESNSSGATAYSGGQANTQPPPYGGGSNYASGGAFSNGATYGGTPNGSPGGTPLTGYIGNIGCGGNVGGCGANGGNGEVYISW